MLVWGGDRLDFSQLPQRIARPSRAESMARTKPATFMAFDILSLRGIPWAMSSCGSAGAGRRASCPTWRRRCRSPPATRDHAVAQNWLRDYADAAVGVEGLL